MQLDINERKDTLGAKKLACYFLQFNAGDKIETVTELSNAFGLSRGTTQNAIKMLTDYGAISLESRGHLGTYIKHMNLKTLLAFCGSTTIVGGMPLPYTKRYQGLATGIIKGTSNDYDISVNMAYMRGSMMRIEMLEENRFDFVITSKLSALDAIDAGKNIRIIYDFGPYSYLNGHAVIFADKNKHFIEDGMRIGVDKDSIDQVNMTEAVCGNRDVDYVNVTYNQSINLLEKHVIDAIVWNVDEVEGKDFNYVIPDELKNNNNDNNTAVMIINKDSEEVDYLLRHIFDEKVVLKYQQMVINDEEETIN